MTASKSAANRKSRILIADDNAPNVELLEAYLTGVDCEIAIAVDGRDTLDKVASFQPDLILLDMMMPKLSGFEVCKKLKHDPATRAIMILMVTALNELGDIERAVDSGTDDFLSKPVNKVELLKRVENMLRLRHVTDEVERLRPYIQGMEDDLGRNRRAVRAGDVSPRICLPDHVGSRSGRFIRALTSPARGRRTDSTPTALGPIAQGWPRRRPTLGWRQREFLSQPQRGCVGVACSDATPLGLKRSFRRPTQGRPPSAANPGLNDAAPLGQIRGVTEESACALVRALKLPARDCRSRGESIWPPASLPISATRRPDPANGKRVRRRATP